MPPLSIMIKPVSGLCNMRCQYCFYADVSQNRQTQSYGLMSLDTLEALVRRAFAYAEGSVSFAFQGGEPTLAGAAFYRALAALQRKYNTRALAVHNSLQTNGYQLDDELLDVLAEHHFLVGLSVDGERECHDRMRLDARGQGSFDRAMATARRLSARGVEFNILCVVNAYVARAPEKTYEALARFGYLQFIPCLDGLDGRASDFSLKPEAYLSFLKSIFDRYYAAFLEGRFVSIRNFDNYINILAGLPPENCAMQGRCGVYYLIEGDGSVFPCDFYVLDAYKMGNINQHSFIRLEKSPVAQAFREASWHVREECGDCRWAFLCRGGCRRDREPLVDGAPGLNRFCACYRAFFDYSAERMRRMARAAVEGARGAAQ